MPVRIVKYLPVSAHARRRLGTRGVHFFIQGGGGTTRPRGPPKKSVRIPKDHRNWGSPPPPHEKIRRFPGGSRRVFRAAPAAPKAPKLGLGGRTRVSAPRNPYRGSVRATRAHAYCASPLHSTEMEGGGFSSQKTADSDASPVNPTLFFGRALRRRKRPSWVFADIHGFQHHEVPTEEACAPSACTDITPARATVCPRGTPKNDFEGGGGEG